MAAEPTIVLCEPIHERGLKILEARGRVVRPAALDEESLVRAVAGAEAVVVRALGRITRRIIEAAPRLKVVGRHGIGVDNVDVEAATEHGVWVVNTPDAPTVGGRALRDAGADAGPALPAFRPPAAQRRMAGPVR